jgi:hypothetical protein
MTIPSWTDLTLYHYLAIGGAAVVVVGLVLYFTPIARMKIPAIFIGVVGGLGAGAGLGVLAMAFYGYHWEKQEDPEAASLPPGPRRPMMPPGAGPGGGPPNMTGRSGPPSNAGGGGRGRGPNSKSQLASLITKLDLLTHHSLAVTLNGEQKEKVRQQIAKLDDEDELSEDDAKVRLVDLLEVLMDQRRTLESAGYRWPGQGGCNGRPPTSPPNPFREAENGKHLKSLRDQLEEKKAE